MYISFFFLLHDERRFVSIIQIIPLEKCIFPGKGRMVVEGGATMCIPPRICSVHYPMVVLLISYFSLQLL